MLVKSIKEQNESIFEESEKSSKFEADLKLRRDSLW